MSPDAGRSPHVALGGDLERALDGQEAAGPAPVERGGVKRLDAPAGVGIDRFGASLVEEMREVGGDRDNRLRSAPDPAQGLGDRLRIGVADQKRHDFKRGRQHRLQHYEMHLQRMLAPERPGVDEDAMRLGEFRLSGGRDLNLAEGRAPSCRRVDRDAAKRDAVRRADDDDATNRLGAARPRAERGRGDRA